MSKSAKKPKPAPAPAPVISSAPVTVNGVTFKKKMVTLPQLKMADGKTIHVRIDSPIVESKVNADRKGRDGEIMKPADVCNVTNLETGEVATIICGMVLKNKLEETYPDQKYVGRAFEITQHKVEGKRWRAYTIAELEAA